MSQVSNKRVLITGATGLIGSHLARRLLAEGATVIAYGRTEDKLRRVFDRDLNNKALSIVVGDVAHGLSRKNIGDVDYIFHAASPISNVDFKEKPVDTIQANIYGSINCLEYLKEQRNGRMIVFSSIAVYGAQFSTETVVSEEETDRTDVLHSVRATYSEAKRMIEVLSHAYSTQYHVDSVIVRLGSVYGYSNPKPNMPFYDFIDKALKGKDIIIYSPGLGRKDNIYVDDVVNGLILVAENGISGEAYNLSAGGEKDNYKSLDEIAGIIVSTVNDMNNNHNVKLVVPPFKGDREPRVMLDNSKIKQLGWKVTVSLENGIRETIRQYMNYR